MKIHVDAALHVREFGRRAFKGETRYYYQVVGYECLVLVCVGQDYQEWQGRAAVALFNFDTVRGDLICQKFPQAPARWRDDESLVQCTVRAVDSLLRGRGVTLSQAVREHLGRAC